MKTFVFMCVFAIITLISPIAFGFNVPTRSGFINDFAGKLSESNKTQLELKAKSIYDKTHNQVVIVIIPSLEGDSVEDVAYNVFNTWKIGSAGLDNGVLFIVSVNDRKTRIETGKGVGAEITDLQSKDILVSLRDPLRANDYAKASNIALDKISSLLESRKGMKTETASHSSSSCSMSRSKKIQFSVVSGIVIIALLFITRYSMRKYAEDKKKFEEHNEMLLRDLMASSLPPPPSPSFIPDPTRRSLFRYQPLEHIEDDEKTPVQLISPMAESYPDSQRPTIPNLVPQTVDNIPVVNFDDEPTHPNLDVEVERLSQMSIHPKSDIKV